MAARFNTKFALIAVAVVGILGVGAAAYFYVQMRQDAERNVAEGDRLFDEGKFEQAASYYGRAVSKEPNNRAYLDLMETAIRSIRPESRAEAGKWYDRLRGIADRRANIDPDDPAGYVAVMEMLYDVAMIEGTQPNWRALRNYADDSLEQLESAGFDDQSDDSAYLQARLFQGIALVQISQRVSLTDEERATAERSLEAATRVNPDMANSYLAALQFGDAVELRRARRDDQAQEAMSAGADRLNAAIAEGESKSEIRPYSIVRRLWVNASKNQSGDEPVPFDEIRSDVETLLPLLEETDDWVLLSEANMPIRAAIRHADAGEFEAFAIDSLLRSFESYTDRHPEDLLLKAMTTDLLVQQQEYNRASDLAEELLNQGPILVGLNAQIRQAMQARGASALVNTEIMRYHEARGNPEAAAIHLENAKAHRAQLFDLVDQQEESPEYLLADADIAFADGDHNSAWDSYQEYLRLYESRGLAPPMLVVDRAFVAAALTDRHAMAAERYDELERLDPLRQFLGERSALAARTFIRLGEFKRAEPMLVEAERRFPGMEMVTQLRAEFDANYSPNEEDVLLLAILRDIDEKSRRGDVQAARDAANEALESRPSEPRLHNSRAMVEILAGDYSGARDALAESLEVIDDPAWADRFETLRSLIGADDNADPVEFVEDLAKRVGQQREDGEVALGALPVLFAARDRKRAEAAAYAAQGQSGRAEDVREDVRRINEVVDEYIRKLPAVYTRETIALRRAHAVESRDSEALARVIADARTLDPPMPDAELKVWEAGRAAMDAETSAFEEGRAPSYTEAQSILEAAIAAHPSELEPRTALAQLFVLQGERQRAMDLYEALVAEKGDRSAAGLSLAELSADMGDHGRARSLYASWRGDQPVERTPVAVRERIIGLEAEHGDPRQAIVWRRAVDRVAPNDVVNRVELAILLLTTAPSREDILQDGREKYSTVRWSGLSADDRNRELKDVKEQWRSEASTIANQLRSAASSNDLAALGAARLLPQLDRGDEAMRLLEARIADAGDGATASMYVDLGRVALGEGDMEAAGAAFTEAVNRQERGEVDAVLGGIYMAMATQTGSTQFLRLAEQYLRDARRKNPTDERVGLTLANCLVLQFRAERSSTGLLDDAETLLTESRTDGGNGYDALMLRATVAELRGFAAMADESKPAQRLNLLLALQAAADGLYDQAAKAAPNRPEPPAERARVGWATFRQLPETARAEAAASLLADGESATVDETRDELDAARQDVITALGNGNQAKIDTSLERLATALTKGVRANVEESLRRQAGYWPAFALGLDLVTLSGDTGRTLRELERYVEENPTNESARWALVQQLVRNSAVDKAMRVAEEGADRAPDSVVWPLRLHQIARNNQETDLMVEYAEDAYRLDPQSSVSYLVAALVTRGRDVDFERVLTVLSDSPEELANEPYLLGAAGVAQLRTGRPRAGLEAMKEAYLAFREAAEADRAGLLPLVPWYDLAAVAFPDDPASIEELAREAASGRDLGSEELTALGVMFAEQANGDERRLRTALDLLQEARRVAARNPNPIVQARVETAYGTVLYQSNEELCEEALAAFEKGLEYVPTNPDLLNNVAYLYYTCHQNPAKGISYARRAVDLMPGQAQYRDTLGELELRAFQVDGDTERLDRAEAELTRSIELADALSTQLNLAEVYIEAGRTAQARRILRDLAEDTSLDARTRARVDVLQGKL